MWVSRHENLRNFVHKIFISMLQLSYILLFSCALLNQSKSEEKLLLLPRKTQNRTSSSTNGKLFELSITYDTMEIPLECLENRSQGKRNQSLSRCESRVPPLIVCSHYSLIAFCTKAFVTLKHSGFGELRVIKKENCREIAKWSSSSSTYSQLNFVRPGSMSSKWTLARSNKERKFVILGSNKSFFEAQRE